MLVLSPILGALCVLGGNNNYDVLRRIVILIGTPEINFHLRCYEKRKEMQIQTISPRRSATNISDEVRKEFGSRDFQESW